MSDFIDYLKEVFAPLGVVQPRKMFGGHGIFYDGVMIALVADDCLYLKVDKHTQAEFSDLDLPAFEYEKNGKTFAMSYRLAPESIYDDPDEALQWARLAYEAALRGKKKT
ncbi:MAG: TfoX/Sxy family protein [Gammaproteobacteria bacterium]|nr:TfoX/Sxy family protein [Gammaproteobacteria bacterium]